MSQLILEFDNISNVPAGITDPTEISQWNSFFDLPVYGNPFTGVTVSGNTVNLNGGSNIILKENLFNNNIHLVSVIDDLSVISLESNTFSSCTSLQSIELSSVQLVGRSSFNLCTVLTSIVLPSCNTVSESAFSQCQSLTTIDLSSLINLGPGLVDDSVFFMISGGTVDLTLPENFLTINNGITDADLLYLAVENSVSVNSAPFVPFTGYSGSLTLVFDNINNTPVTNPNNVSEWNSYFDLPSWSTSFSSVTTGSTFVTLIGGENIPFKQSLFESITNLIEVIDEGCVCYIGFNSFSNCTSLQTIDLPNVLITSQSSFYNCVGLSIVNLPSLTTSSPYLFDSCTSLAQIDLPSLKNSSEGMFYSCSLLTEVNLPLLEIVTGYNDDEIGGYFFVDCSSLTGVTLPSLTAVGEEFFGSCTSLSMVSLPACQNLGGFSGSEKVFFNISGSTIDLTIPESVLNINNGKPDGDILTLAVYNDVTINSNPFVPFTGYTGDLTLVWDNLLNVPVSNPNSVSEWNSYFNLPSWSTPFSSVTTGSTSVTLIGGENIPFRNNFLNGNSNILEILDNGCVCYVGANETFGYPIVSSSLLNISLPSLTILGSFSIVSCSNLTGCTIPLVESISDQSLQDCPNLTELNFPEVKVIGRNSLGADYSNLQTIYIPNCLNLGFNNQFNYVFDYIGLHPSGQDIELTVSQTLMTNNLGFPDGDLLRLLSNNNVTVVEIPDITPTPTPTPSATPVPQPTPTPTPTQSSTTTPTVTPTNTNTPSVTATQTNTPSQTGTPPVTPTNTPSNTPTPSQFIFEVNQQYQYTIEMLGAFDGQPLTGGTVPYPSIMGADGVEYIQLNAIQIGGFNGLNN